MKPSLFPFLTISARTYRSVYGGLKQNKNAKPESMIRVLRAVIQYHTESSANMTIQYLRLQYPTAPSRLSLAGLLPSWHESAILGKGSALLGGFHFLFHSLVAEV